MPRATASAARPAPPRRWSAGAIRTRRCLNSFLSVFHPADDPQYVVLVMLDEPQRVAVTKGYATAGWNAAPTVGKIVARIGPILGVPPKLEDTVSPV